MNALFFQKKRVILGIGAALLTLGLLWYSSSSSDSKASVDELSGLLYMVAHTEHQLSPSLDVSGPLEHSVWLPPDSLPSNSKDWNHRMTLLARTSPVVIFSKTYCPYSKRAKGLIGSYKLDPPPKIVEVDLRDDNNVIKRLLTRLTGRGTFPNVILRGRSIGGYDDIAALHESGQLRLEFENAGVRVTGSV